METSFLFYKLILLLYSSWSRSKDQPFGRPNCNVPRFPKLFLLYEAERPLCWIKDFYLNLLNFSLNKGVKKLYRYLAKEKPQHCLQYSVYTGVHLCILTAPLSFAADVSNMQYLSITYVETTHISLKIDHQRLKEKVDWCV